MSEIILVVEHDNVIVNGKECLKNFWYKFLIQLLQKEFDAEDIIFQNTLGGIDYQSFWDLLVSQEDLINSIGFVKSDFDDRLNEIGKKIETIDENESGNMWIYNNKVISVDSKKVIGYSIQLFDDLILPFLQLKHHAEIKITGTDLDLIHFFKCHLYRNGFIIHEEIVNISTVEVINEDSWALKWKGLNKFEIKCDLNTFIPIALKVKTLEGKIINKTVNIVFPFFKKNDVVMISVSCKNNIWSLSAKNINNDLEFKSEINI